MKSKSRAIRDWFLTDSGIYRGLFLFLTVLALLIFVGPQEQMAPPASSRKITTSHEIFLPPNYTIDKKVINKFVESENLGGAGGLASVQVERSFEKYKKEVAENSLNFLTLETETESRNLIFEAETDIWIDYWEARKNFNVAVHSQDVVGSVKANKWGYYLPVNIKIKDKKLVVERKFGFSGLAQFIIIVIWAAGIVAALLINWIISKIFENIAYPHLKKIKGKILIRD